MKWLITTLLLAISLSSTTLAEQYAQWGDDLYSLTQPYQQDIDEELAEQQRLERVWQQEKERLAQQRQREAQRLAAILGVSAESILEDNNAKAIDFAGMEKVAPTTAKMLRDVQQQRENERTTPTPKPEAGSKEWFKKLGQELAHEASETAIISAENIMPTLLSAFFVSLLAFFLVFSIFTRSVKALSHKGKFKLALSPFIPSAIVLFFADFLPYFEVDGEIEHEAIYPVMAFVFLMSCWIIWRKAKDKP